MTIFSEQFLPAMQESIAPLQLTGNPNFSTVDVIKSYIGHYNKDRTTVRFSINANIGRFLSRNRTALGINKIASNQYVIDDNRESSHTSVWEFV